VNDVNKSGKIIIRLPSSLQRSQLAALDRHYRSLRANILAHIHTHTHTQEETRATVVAIATPTYPVDWRRSRRCHNGAPTQVLSGWMAGRQAAWRSSLQTNAKLLPKLGLELTFMSCAYLSLSSCELPSR